MLGSGELQVAQTAAQAFFKLQKIFRTVEIMGILITMALQICVTGKISIWTCAHTSIRWREICATIATRTTHGACCRTGSTAGIASFEMRL